MSSFIIFRILKGKGAKKCNNLESAIASTRKPSTVVLSFYFPYFMLVLHLIFFFAKKLPIYVAPIFIHPEQPFHFALLSLITRQSPRMNNHGKVGTKHSNLTYIFRL